MKISSTKSARRKDAFTLTDLLAVIAILALVAIVTVPALAGVQNKGGRLECANNLRQIGMESMVYAGESQGWLPIITLGAFNNYGQSRNYLGAVYYSQYVYEGLTGNVHITTNEPPVTSGEGYQNLGYLYQDGQAGNGSIFFCPAVWGQTFGASAYSPLLTTDVNGFIQSSYFYNPRIVSSGSVGSPPVNTLRRYQTVNRLEPHRLFAVDSINAGSSPGVGINIASMEHVRDRGWNVLFTDGSVQFSRLTQNNNYYYNLFTQRLIEAESSTSYQEYDEVFDFLEQDH